MSEGMSLENIRDLFVRFLVLFCLLGHKIIGLEGMASHTKENMCTKSAAHISYSNICHIWHREKKGFPFRFDSIAFDFMVVSIPLSLSVIFDTWKWVFFWLQGFFSAFILKLAENKQRHHIRLNLFLRPQKASISIFTRFAPINSTMNSNLPGKFFVCIDLCKWNYALLIWYGTYLICARMVRMKTIDSGAFVFAIV